MDNIISFTGNKKNDVPNKDIQFKDGRTIIDIDEKDSFVYARVSDFDDDSANTAVYTEDFGEALFLIMCLIEHIKDLSGVNAAELISIIVEAFFNAHCNEGDG